MKIFPQLRLLFALGCAMIVLAPPTPARAAETLTETKIRLMAETLRARDAGELDLARQNAEQLRGLMPNDSNVLRLQREIETLIAARAEAAKNPPPPPMVEVAIPPPEQPRVAPSVVSPASAPPAPAVEPAPSEAALEAEAEALARAESTRLSALVDEATKQRQRAHKLAGNGRYDEALALVASARATLPLNSMTQAVATSLDDERKSITRRKEDSEASAAAEAEAAAQKAARKAAAAAAKQQAAEARAAEKANREAAAAARQEASAAPTPPPAEPAENTAFTIERAEVGALVAKGRSQYLAGDVDGAQETFRSVEARDPDNAEAKGFLLRIAGDKAEVGALNREKTRAQLLEEVTKSWQRPGIYQERSHGAESAAAAAPLAKKLNEIILPSVSFTRAEIGQVVAALSAISEEFDNTGGTPKGVNLVLLDPTNKTPTVTITLRNSSLKRVLDFVTESIGYQYEVQADAVVLRPGGETSTLDTAFFPVTRATVLRMTGIGGAVSVTATKVDPLSSSGAANEGGSSSSGGEGPAMKAFLQQAGVNFEAVPGSSLAYDGSALIVTQTARNIDRIRNILNRYNDVRQVEIEAKFIEVQEGALDELGVQWNLSRRGVAQINPTTGAPLLDSNGRQIFLPQETYTTSNVNRSLSDTFSSLSNT